MVYEGNLPRSACKNFEQDLVLYYYGDLMGADHSRVEIHLKSCSSCRLFLQDLHTILPLTSTPDEPPQAFWESYSKEIHSKLKEAETRVSWWTSLSSLFHFRPWPVPALATAFVLILALTMTFTGGLWGPEEPTDQEEILQEILPMAESLEFFKSIEFLESIELLESLEEKEFGPEAI